MNSCKHVACTTTEILDNYFDGVVSKASLGTDRIQMAALISDNFLRERLGKTT